MASRYIDYDIMMALLRVYARAPRSLHIGNVLGRPHSVSDLERELDRGMTFDLQERAQANRCARELQDAGLIVAEYTDLSNRYRRGLVADQTAISRFSSKRRI